MAWRLSILVSMATVIAGQEPLYSRSQTDFTGTQQRQGPECDVPVNAGTCSGQFSRYHYDPAAGTCKLFSYTGCGGNLNNFESMAECNRRCICSRPVNAGPCNKQTLRYFYNKATRLCQLFVYGGCNGNDNNFPSEIACNDVCKKYDVPQRCARRPEYGTCSNTTLRYYYDQNCECCQTFKYSGCDGNNNNFETERQCLSKCSGLETSSSSTTSTTTSPVTTTKISDTVPERCRQRRDKGPCSSKIVRYYYNSRKNRCEFFLWGGCGGTANNFRSRRFCMQMCSV